jgi:hypothetical protein
MKSDPVRSTSPRSALTFSQGNRLHPDDCGEWDLARSTSTHSRTYGRWKNGGIKTAQLRLTPPAPRQWHVVYFTAVLKIKSHR